MPEPIGKQIEVVCLATTGHHVVLGTAGSGKTTMAVYRARYLSNPALPGGGKTLVITYNKALMRYIAGVDILSTSNVIVENYHRFARGYLNSKGLLPDKAIVSMGQRRVLIETAVQDVKKEYVAQAFFQRHLKFFSDEIKWIASHNLPSVEAYIEARRTGRADANLSRALRPLMWQIHERYLELRRSTGRLYDFDDIASAVSAAFDNDNKPRLYKHIVIDEGQDMSPEMLRSLAKAIPPDGSITFFGDSAQQIYGRGMSWRDAGLRPLKVWEFRQNYRNTLSIAKLGLAISKMPYFLDQTDMVEPIFPAADGPKPALVEINIPANELPFAVRLAIQHARTRAVAILLRTHAQLADLKPLLPKGAISLREDFAGSSRNIGLYYGTYHSAKGLEFDVVLLPCLSNGELPSHEDIATDGLEEALAQDGRLFYVGVTRAKSELVITYTGTQSLLLPTDRDLYTESQR